MKLTILALWCLLCACQQSAGLRGAVCGDGICAASEIGMCPQDCGSAVGPPSGSGSDTCNGNGVCEPYLGESTASCPDCAFSFDCTGSGAATACSNCLIDDLFSGLGDCDLKGMVPGGDALDCVDCIGFGFIAPTCQPLCGSGFEAPACVECVAQATHCGNGTCDPFLGETADTCPADCVFTCATFATVCTTCLVDDYGSAGACDENFVAFPGNAADCAACVGSGMPFGSACAAACGSGETHDCDQCVDTQATQAVCGNGLCQTALGESADNCPADCPVSAIPGDECANAIPLTLGSAVSGDTTGFTGDYGSSNVACLDDRPTGPDVVYAATLTAGTAYAVALDSPADNTLSISVVGPGSASICTPDESACVIGKDNVVDRTVSLAYAPSASGNYFFIVDGDGAASGPYTITVSPGVCGDGICVAPVETPDSCPADCLGTSVAGDECGNAIPLTLGSAVSGDTSAGAADDYGASPTAAISCLFNQFWTGPDLVYSASLTAGTTYTATVDDSFSGTGAISIVGPGSNSSVCNPAESACVAGAAADSATFSVIYTPTTSGTYYFIIDGQTGSAAGPFTLTLSD